MNRVFRKKYMKLMAVLASVAVLAGSMDINMLCAQAAQEYDSYDENSAGAMTAADTGPDAGREGHADADLPDDGGLQNNPGADDGTDLQNDEDKNGGEDLQNDEDKNGGEDLQDGGDESGGEDLQDGGDENGGEDLQDGGDENGGEDLQNGTDNDGADLQDDADINAPADSQDGAGDDAALNDDKKADVSANPNSPGIQAADAGDPTVVKAGVTISGIGINDKIYDGKPVICNGEARASAKIGLGSSARDEDVTASVTFSYEITGTTEAGTAYMEKSDTLNTGMPREAGTYMLKVTASGSYTDTNTNTQYDYTGSKDYSFNITRKTVTVKAHDKQIKITATVLDPSFFTYSYTGFVGTDTFDKEPKVSCDTVEFGTPGTYPISISDAEAGPNYTIVYQAGTLTVQGKEPASVSGVKIEDKEYDGKPIGCGQPVVQGSGSDIGYKYRIYGVKESGEEYTTGDIDGTEPIDQYMPSDAGTYALKVTADDVNHTGNWEYNFMINRKRIIVKADDFSIKKGGSLPPVYTYTMVENYDFLDGDGFDEDREDPPGHKFRKPKLTCSTDNTDTPGEYTITPSGAYAGANYTIEYQTGKLTIEEEEQISISGIAVKNKIYDGEPAEFEIKPEASVKLEGGTTAENIVFNFKYSISGVKADGTSYLSTDIENNRPKDAGQYILQVTAEGTSDQDNKTYKYTKEYSFTITPRPIVVKVLDVELETEDEIPQTYDFETGGMGFLDGDDFQKKPSFICDIKNTDEPGTYIITASGADAGANYGITYQTGTLTVIEKEIEKTRELVKVIAPQPVINVENGTPLDQIALPESVTIKTRYIGAQGDASEEITETAQVAWERRPAGGTSYSAAKKEEQTFKLNGTVILPPDVDPAGKESLLTAVIQVSVREELISRDQVSAPAASIASGTVVRRGTRVELSCETEGATIYYTLDGRKPPTRESNRYAYPIEINGLTVIWAFAYKEGYPDSAAVKFTYFVGDSSIGGDDEDPDEPEVPKEDIPSDGKIPSGLWATEIAEYVYTGRAVKPAVRVYDYKTLLQEKKDYTIAYKNNVNAGDKNAPKAPTVVITGKGNYEGKLNRTFTISPKNINDRDVSIDDITLAYNKKAQKPSPVVVWNGKKLANKKDYTVQDGSYTDVGTRSIAVTGCGNYTGERKFEFTITDGIPVSKLKISKIPNQVYTGKEIEPKPVVKYQGSLLEWNVNYTVTYEDNTDVGTATAVIKGTGRYAGTRRVTFKITGIADLSKAKVDLKFTNGTPVYTGQEIYADEESVVLNVKGEDGTTTERRLTKGTDFEVAYQNNVKAGNATAVFTGKGAYSGKIKKNFKIASCNMGSDKVKIKLSSSYGYMKGGCRPEPQVTFGSKTLKPGTDYTLSYKQNNEAGRTATVIIRGKGNFSGSTDKTFTVVSQDIGKTTVAAADKVYQNKKNIFKTTVRVLDTNGKPLSAGRDYDKNAVYTYDADTKVNDGVLLRKAGDPVDQSDVIPAGTTIRVTLAAAGNNYNGTVSGTFRIVSASIARAKVTIPVQTYTGKEIKPDASSIRVEMNGAALPATEYEITGYSGNINKGTAKVTIHGLNNYGGTKTVSFKIKSKVLTD